MVFKLYVMRIKNLRERLENLYLFILRVKVFYIKKKEFYCCFKL